MSVNRIFPSEHLDQFVVRLPDGMRKQIKNAAVCNKRSMNAEIVARLEASEETLRDRFAMAALAGVDIDGCDPETTARWVYDIADAMLARRLKGGAP